MIRQTPFLLLLPMLTMHLTAFAQYTQTSEATEKSEKFEEFEKSEESDSLYAVYMSLAIDRINSFRFDEAIPWLDSCRQIDNKNPDVLNFIGYCHYQLGRFPEAKAFFGSVVRLDSQNVVALNRLALISFNESDFKRAGELYSTLTSLDSTNSYYYKQLARVKLGQGDIISAIVNFDLALRFNSRDLDALKHMTRIFLSLEHFDKADSLVQVGLQLDYLNREFRMLKGRSAYKQKEYQEVISVLEPLTKDDTTVLQAQLLGISNFHAGNYNKAIEWLRFVVTEDGGSDGIHYYLGSAYRKIGDIPAAIEELQTAVEKGISDNLSHYYTQLALTYENDQDHVNAIRAYKAAYETSGKKELIYYLARSYDEWYLDKRTALAYYEIYLELNDTLNRAFMDHSRSRVGQLEEIIHLDLDSLD